MKWLLLPIAFLLLAGCVSGQSSKTRTQSLAPGISLRLPTEPVFGLGPDVVQLVQARYRDQHQVFQSFVQSSPGRFVITMAVPSGPHIMQIEWSHDGITAQRAAIAPKALSAERTLADLMLVYASTMDLRAALSGAQVIEGPGGERKIVQNGKDVIVVKRPVSNPWSGTATLMNFASDYALKIQSQRAAP